MAGSALAESEKRAGKRKPEKKSFGEWAKDTSKYEGSGTSKYEGPGVGEQIVNKIGEFVSRKNKKFVKNVKAIGNKLVEVREANLKRHAAERARAASGAPKPERPSRAAAAAEMPKTTPPAPSTGGPARTTAKPAAPKRATTTPSKPKVKMAESTQKAMTRVGNRKADMNKSQVEAMIASRPNADFKSKNYGKPVGSPVSNMGRANRASPVTTNSGPNQAEQDNAAKKATASPGQPRKLIPVNVPSQSTAPPARTWADRQRGTIIGRERDRRK